MESVDTLNKRLTVTYGYFSTTTLPLWRIVFSEDQMEKRWVTHTKDGFALLEPEVQEVPKYRQWIHGKYILERIIAIPEETETDIVDKFSYEPVWVFQDKNENPLPPIWSACELIIDSVYRAAGRAVGAKYKDPEVYDKKDSAEAKRAKVDKLVEELFGNETDTGDALAYKSGVGYTGNPNKIQ